MAETKMTLANTTRNVFNEYMYTFYTIKKKNYSISTILFLYITRYNCSTYIKTDFCSYHMSHPTKIYIIYALPLNIQLLKHSCVTYVNKYLNS